MCVGINTYMSELCLLKGPRSNDTEYQEAPHLGF